MAVSINGTQHNSIECHYAECGIFIVVLSANMLSVAMVNVLAPTKTHRVIGHVNEP
jgi:hypothetical protein